MKFSFAARHAPAKIAVVAVLAMLAVFVSPTVASATNVPVTWSTIKYNTTFTYTYATDSWAVINTDGSKALKDIDDVQEVLCSDYDTGLGKPCAAGATYIAKSTVVPPSGFASCVYIQGDGGASGSWDTVPGDPDKRVCAPTPEEDGGDDTPPPPPPPTYGVCTNQVGPIQVTPSTAAGLGFSQTFQRDGGSLTWAADGIVFSTPAANDKITFGLSSTSFQIPLSQLAGLSFGLEHITDGSIASQRLSANVPMDINGAAPGGFTTIVVEAAYNEGSLDMFDGGDAIVWSSNAIPGFPNRDTFKSWDYLLLKNPDAVLLGQMLVNQGGGNAGLSDKLTSLTVGNREACTTYTFVNPPPPPPPTVLDPNPKAIVVGMCGMATVDLSNEFVAKENTVGSPATFEIKINGALYRTVKLEPGQKFDPLDILFDEDSGQYFVQVFSNGVLLASVEVCSDCEANLVPDPPTPPMSTATCDADGVLSAVAVDPDNRWTGAYSRVYDGPGAYSLVYTVTGANDEFASGLKTKSFPVVVPAKTGYQSTNYKAPCYKQPPVFSGPGEPDNPKLADTGTDGDRLRNQLLLAGSLLLLGAAGIVASVKLRRRHRAVLVNPLTGDIA